MTVHLTARLTPRFGGGFDVACAVHVATESSRDAAVEIAETIERESAKWRAAFEVHHLEALAATIVTLDRKLRLHTVVDGKKTRLPGEPVSVRWEGPRDVLGRTVNSLAARLESLPGPKSYVNRNMQRQLESVNVAVEWNTRRVRANRVAVSGTATLCGAVGRLASEPFLQVSNHVVTLIAAEPFQVGNPVYVDGTGRAARRGFGAQTHVGRATTDAQVGELVNVGMVLP